MIKIYPLVFILFCFKIAYSQSNQLSKEEITMQYREIDNSNSEKSIKNIKELIESSEKIGYKKGIVDGKMKLLYMSYHRSDYKKTLKIIREIEALQLQDYEKLATLSIYKSYANKALGLTSQELKNIKDALKYSKLVEKPDRKHLVKSYAHNRFSVYYDYKSPDSLLYHLKKELEELEKVSDDGEFTTKKHNKIALNNINIGNFYLGVHKPQRLDLAEPYYLKVYAYRTTQPAIFEEHEMEILNGVGRFYLEKGVYEKTIELANEVLQVEKHKKKPFSSIICFNVAYRFLY